MKNIIYYLLLLVFIALVAGFLLFGRADAMGMGQMLGISAGLILYGSTQNDGGSIHIPVLSANFQFKGVIQKGISLIKSLLP